MAGLHVTLSLNWENECEVERERKESRGHEDTTQACCAHWMTFSERLDALEQSFPPDISHQR